MCLADDDPSHVEKLIQIRKHQEDRIKEANRNRVPSRTLSQRVGKDAYDIISFKHVNINGINAHDSCVELSKTMGFLDAIEAGVFIVVETQ